LNEVDELRNFWNDEKKVEKVEKELLKNEQELENKNEEKLIIGNDLPKEKINEVNFDNTDKAEKRKFITALIIFIMLLILSIILTFMVMDRIKELKNQNENQIYSKYMKTS
jgi:uncharacterized membrane protein